MVSIPRQMQRWPTRAHQLHDSFAQYSMLVLCGMSFRPSRYSTVHNLVREMTSRCSRRCEMCERQSLLEVVVDVSDYSSATASTPEVHARARWPALRPNLLGLVHPALFP